MAYPEDMAKRAKNEQELVVYMDAEWPPDSACAQMTAGKFQSLGTSNPYSENTMVHHDSICIYWDIEDFFARPDFEEQLRLCDDKADKHLFFQQIMGWYTFIYEYKPDHMGSSQEPTPVFLKGTLPQNNRDAAFDAYMLVYDEHSEAWYVVKPGLSVKGRHTDYLVKITLESQASSSSATEKKKDQFSPLWLQILECPRFRAVDADDQRETVPDYCPMRLAFQCEVLLECMSLLESEHSLKIEMEARAEGLREDVRRLRDRFDKLQAAYDAEVDDRKGGDKGGGKGGGKGGDKDSRKGSGKDADPPGGGWLNRMVALLGAWHADDKDRFHYLINK